MKKKKIRLFAPAAAIPMAAAATLGATQLPAYAAATQGITQEACNAGTLHWVHLATTYHGNVCIGFQGHKDPGLYIRSLCPGNNYGAFAGRFAAGSTIASAFYPGERFYFSSHFYLSDVIITSWKGNSTC